MSAFYGRLQGTADRLLAKFGQAITITRTATDGATTAYTTTGAVVGTVKHTLGDSGIAIGDDRILLDHTVTPQPGDRITYNGQSRVIVDPVVNTNPGGTHILFECYARAG